MIPSRPRVIRYAAITICRTNKVVPMSKTFFLAIVAPFAGLWLEATTAAGAGQYEGGARP